MRALLLTLLCAGPSWSATGNKVLDAEQRLERFSDRVAGERALLRQAIADHAFSSGGNPNAYLAADDYLQALTGLVKSAEIAVALSADEPQALATAGAAQLELAGRLASYRDLIGKNLEDPAEVEAGLKAMIDADLQASILKSDLLERYPGPAPLAVTIRADGGGKLALEAFVPKDMPPQAALAGVQKSAAKRSLEVKIADLPGLD